MLKSSEWSNVGGDNSFTTKEMFGEMLEIQTIKATPIDDGNFAMYSSSISTNGDVLAIGAHNSSVISNRQGAVYVFDRVDGIYSQRQRIDSPEPQEFSNFGLRSRLNSIADTIFIAAPNQNGSSNSIGKVFIYKLNVSNNNFEHFQTLQSPTPTANKQFGVSLQCDSTGDRLVVGENSTNKCYIYSYDGSTYVLEQTLTFAANTTSNQREPTISSDGLFVAVYGRHNGGTIAGSQFISIWKRVSSTWSLSWAIDHDIDIINSNNYNYVDTISISNNGDTFIISSPNENGSNGRVLVYKLTGIDTYTKIQTLEPTPGGTSQSYGAFINILPDASALYICRFGSLAPFPKGYVEYRYWDPLTESYLIKSRMTTSGNWTSIGRSLAVTTDGSIVTTGAISGTGRGMIVFQKDS